MSKKSYLSSQIKMMSIATYDLFSDTEYELYEKIIQLMNTIQRQKEVAKKNDKVDPTVLLQLIGQKKETQNKLREQIQKHRGTPRQVRLKNVLNPAMLKKNGDNIQYPSGVNWMNLKVSRKVTQFLSEQSRALGLKHDDITFDKIIVKWKSEDILEQIVHDGFDLPILLEDGTVQIKHFIFMTASAGQLRTDKIQCITQAAWDKIYNRLMCGLTFDSINEKNGINSSY